MKQSELQHLFETFSILSDAQEIIGLLPYEQRRRAHDLINHAKEHLLVVLEANAEHLHGVIKAALKGCSLAAEAQELVEREGEPALCECGKHYVGAECPERRTRR